MVVCRRVRPWEEGDEPARKGRQELLVSEADVAKHLGFLGQGTSRAKEIRLGVELREVLVERD